MASDESGAMQQDSRDNPAGFQVQANSGSDVHQVGHDLRQLNQVVEGQQNQTIGQIFGGVVVYVSGGQAIITPPQTDTSSQGGVGAKVETEQRQELGSCPYRGLLAYHEKDSGFYFGRSQEIAQLWFQLQNLYSDSSKVTLLPIYGPSGSGKSSLARAGLIPKLAQEALPGKEQARIAVMVPGTQPLQALAAILVRIATQDATVVGKTQEFAAELAVANPVGEFEGLHRIASRLPKVQTVPLVLMVDQFEEVYSLCKDRAARDAFIGNLLYAAAEATQAVSVIVTFRSDFLAETFQHPWLNRLFSEQGFLAPMMDEGALREAIAQPAATAGALLDEGTIALLIEQTQGREGALPLLQFALTQIWDGIGKGVEPAQTLRAIGGVGGALADSAQRIYDGLSKAEQDIARRFFLGLVQLGEGVQDTRRRVPVSSLVAARDKPEQVRQVMGKFVSPEARLITLSSERGVELAEVSHEALIQHWGLLQGWLEQNRDLLRQQRRIESSAVVWLEQGKLRGNLLQGSPLTEAIQFNKQRKTSFPLSDLARTFVKRSVSHRRWKKLDISSWLIATTLLFVAVTDNRLHENSIQVNLARLDKERSYEERQAIESLTEGCYDKQRLNLPGYIAERLFGNCRSLSQAPLSSADLHGATLRSADLRSADLHGATLRSADLRSADLISTDLRGANLISADLRGANLISADLISADLISADLSSANLSSANLSSANLSSADLHDTYLRSANLRSANLSSANLRSANLSSADLRSANLSQTNLTSANLISANLSRVDLRSANLRSTNFRSADLSSVNLNSVNLSGADLSLVNLSGANLSGTDLSSANLSSADLNSANFRNMIALNTDFRRTKNLTQEQLEGKEPPLLCNSPLPKSIKIDKDRDCMQMSSVLLNTYSEGFENLDNAQKHVDERRQRIWGN